MSFVIFVVKIRYLQSDQTDLLLDTNQRRQLPMTIAIILGTRPEIIKMAPVIRECQRRGLDHSTIHTGQHYSYQMDRIFFEQLELPQPDHNLDVGSGNHGEQTGRILADLEGVLMAKRPDIAPFEQPLQGCNAGNRGWPLIG